ncbi:MAG: type III pantothenate kinase [Bacteroidota bacterium]
MSQAILSVDMGNTRTQIGFFAKGELQWVERLLTTELTSRWPDLLQRIPSEQRLKVGWMSVARPVDLADLPGWDQFEHPPEIIFVHSQMPLPIVNAYATPETLGTDRIVAVIGALSHFGGGPVLVIDAGTALTYDVADADGVYRGGGIGPGIQMRFRALHEFTARLPLIDFDPDPPLPGDSTQNSIRSGVLQGILAEVEGMIERYRLKFGANIKIILTGGDRPFFENHLKNINFADANLNLRGIYHILTV